MNKITLMFSMFLMVGGVSAQDFSLKQPAFKQVDKKTSVENGNSVRLVSVSRQANLNGKARVVLIGEDFFGDGSGYQLLLDADCNTYDKIIKYKTGYEGSDYSDYEYTIPVDADAAFDTKNVVTGGKRDSVDIPEGLYDMCIVLPYAPLKCIYFAKGQKWKKVNFSGDFVYTFHVHSGSDSDETTSTLKYDLGVSQKWGWGISGLSGTEQVQFVLNNYGHEVYDQNIKCYFQIDKQQPVIYELAELPEPGESSTVVFPQTADLSEIRMYDIKIWIDDPLGWTTFNDTLSLKVNNYAPLSLPYKETFDYKNHSKFINQWKMLNLNNDQTTWYFEELIECRDNMFGRSGSMGYACHTLNEANDLLVSPCIGMKKGKHTLSFKTRAGSNEFSEKLNVYVGAQPTIEGARLIDKLVLNNDYWLDHTYDFEMSAESPAYVLFHMVSDANQYLLFIDEVELVHDPTAISAAVENGISLYPGMVEDYLYVHSDSTPMESIAIYTIAGNPVYNSGTSANDYRIDLQNMDKGVYIVRIRTSLGSSEYKVIKI